MTDASTSANSYGVRHFLLGTAGHIDHGKTSLVRALTGVDTDRLPEEQRRGMTIELGFADFLVGDVHFGVVDVPGHERFVRTMVAGATGIDVALLVIAADDSIMPQTVEHFEILNLLGIRRAVVALTKVDAVDEDLQELVHDEIRELLAPSPFRDAPICPVSSIKGMGLERLKESLAAAVEGLTPSPTHRPFRMCCDRVFSVPGRGTVVTGSVLRGTVEPGETLEVLPAKLTCRVRGLQNHGTEAGAVFSGQRAAINLSGVDRERIDRGMELATPAYLQPGRILDARVHCLSSSRRPLKSGSSLRLGMGTRETLVRFVLYEGAQLEPGAAEYAQLRSAEVLVAAHGQRFILRDSSANRTIGGGVVLAALPTARRRHDAATAQAVLRALDTGDAATRVEQVLRLSGFSTISDLELCARAGVEVHELAALLAQLKRQGRRIPIPGTDIHVVPAGLDDLTNRLVAWLERFHRAHPELPGRNLDSVLGWLERVAGRAVARRWLDDLLKRKQLKLLGRFVCSAAFAPALSTADEKILHAMLDEFRAAGFQPPALEALRTVETGDRKRLDRLATLAVALGELVLIEPKMYLHADAERSLREKVLTLVTMKGSATVAEIREMLDSTRKYVVPFLEYLDRIGVTRRLDDRRVPASNSAGPGPGS